MNLFRWGAMKNNANVVLTAGLLLVILSGCFYSPLTPHETFKERNQSEVGRNINEPRFRYFIPKNIKSLPNGNIEYEYHVPRKECHYFYEIEPKTGLIVGWRFEGSESECSVNPYT